MTTLLMAASLPYGGKPVIPYSSASQKPCNAVLCSSLPLSSALSAPSSPSSFNAASSTRSNFLSLRLGSKKQHGRVYAVGHKSANVDLSPEAEERVRLKQELLNSLEATDGSLSQESLDIIASLRKLNPNPEASKVPELSLGYFQAVKATLKGKAVPKGGVYESSFTLGRSAFNAFQPREHEVIHEETYNHVATQGKDDEYLLASELSIKNPTASLEPLKGYLIHVGKFSFSAANEIEVAFIASVLRPADPENEDELSTWKQLFAEKNPSMDERGFMTVKLPGAKGKIDHIYLDDELRIVKGSGGNTFITRPLPGPAIPSL